MRIADEHSFPRVIRTRIDWDTVLSIKIIGTTKIWCYYPCSWAWIPSQLSHSSMYTSFVSPSNIIHDRNLWGFVFHQLMIIVISNWYFVMNQDPISSHWLHSSCIWMCRLSFLIWSDGLLSHHFVFHVRYKHHYYPTSIRFIFRLHE
jgi:hypothetical protein